VRRGKRERRNSERLSLFSGVEVNIFPLHLGGKCSGQIEIGPDLLPIVTCDFRFELFYVK
jgi:hypothetical protein